MRYDKIIGTGGIGVGMLFHSRQSATLGRNESRLVTLSDAKDYCKQHIVLYYTSELLKNQASVYPIGFVGKDDAGQKLISEMEREGMNVEYVGQSDSFPTMISICLQYPDKDGCNITAMNNAVIEVTSEYVCNSMDEIGLDGKTIVAAIPEVSVECRVAMLKKAKEAGALCVLSIPAVEAEEFIKQNIFIYCDILAVNEEEGCAILGEQKSGRDLVHGLYEELKEKNPKIWLLVTCGKDGSYSAGEAGIEYIPPLNGNVVNTTGAGDAFLGGTIAGLSMGLKLQKGRDDSCFGETKLESAAELGTLCAGMAVESQDSIARNVTAESIKRKIKQENWEVEGWPIN